MLRQYPDHRQRSWSINKAYRLILDTKDLLNDSSIHHGRNLVCLMNRKGFKVEDLEKALQLSQKQVEELTEMKKEAGE